jgi:Fe-S oxidoreductase
MLQVYAPGCALMIYKPSLAERVRAHLSAEFGTIAEHRTCCRHAPALPPGTQVINTCAGCDRRYRELYEGISTMSLWEVLAESAAFPFPNYHGAEMTVQDACPTRTEHRVHLAVRRLLDRMNIRVIEPPHTRTGAVCCGDSLFGVVPDEDVKAQMRHRAGEMPRHDVVVYCVSCVKAMHIGGRRPRYLVDLLFSEDTSAGTFDPTAWHAQLQAFIDRDGDDRR